MHFKFRHLHKIVGAFFILACVILFILLTLVARGQRWFQEYAHYTTFVSRAEGLETGSSVMIQGLEVGKVDRVSLTTDDRVRIDLSLYRQHASRIREGTEVAITSPLIGASRLSLTLGSRDAPLIKKDSILPSRTSGGEGLDALVASASQLTKSLSDPKGDLMMALKNINSATAALDEGLTKKDGNLRLLIDERVLYDRLVSSSNHLDRILAGLDQSTPDMQDAIAEARRGLDEANKVILALQKSIFLRGNIEHYLKEDALLRADGR